MAYTIRLAKESFKFSGTHFTIFGPREGERMHGHNYQVALEIHLSNELDPKLGFAFDFNTVKPILKRLCDELDEYILIPEKSPYLSIKKSGTQLILLFGEKEYQLPLSDVRLLPVVNITVEELAHYLCQGLIKEWTQRPKKLGLSLTVEETRGQSVTYSESFS